jgi:hypothetical protein
VYNKGLRIEREREGEREREREEGFLPTPIGYWAY